MDADKSGAQMLGAFIRWLSKQTIQTVAIFLLATLLYCNTFYHEYALDDRIVIVGNEFVHKGVSGIPGIFSKDTYFSYFDRIGASNQLQGGRYRPLSVATFALEQEVFGAQRDGEVDSLLEFGVAYKSEAPYEARFFQEMHIRHVVNVLLFALSAILLLFVFRLLVFRSSPIAALVAAVLFVSHPVHTEVVANVKSRDEILSLLFICLTFLSAQRYAKTNKMLWLLVASIAMLLALLSKEYAVTLMVLLPISWYVCDGYNWRRIAKSILPFVIVFAIYGLLRVNAVGLGGREVFGDIQTDPYAFASGGQKAATVIATSLRYLRLLLVPSPLSADYSYSHFPYVSFANPLVWLSCVVHLGLVLGLVYFTRVRSMWALAIGWYLLNLLLVNNFLFDIGATMGERLIFHSSVGFVIAVVLLGQYFLSFVKQEKSKIWLATVIVCVIVSLFSFKVISRNVYWKNDATLFMKDIEVVPNSFLVNENVAGMLVNMSDFEKEDTIRTKNLRRAVRLFSKVLNMKADYVLGYANRSIAYLKLNMADSMLADLETVRGLYPVYPSLPQLYYHDAMLYRQQGNFERSVYVLRTASQLVPGDNELKAILRTVETEADSVMRTGVAVDSTAVNRQRKE